MLKFFNAKNAGSSKYDFLLKLDIGCIIGTGIKSLHFSCNYTERSNNFAKVFVRYRSKIIL